MQTLYPIRIKNYNFLFNNNNNGKQNNSILIKGKNNSFFNTSKIQNKTFRNQTTQTTRNKNYTGNENNCSFLTFLKENSIKGNSFYLSKLRGNEDNYKVKISRINLKLPFNCKIVRRNLIRNKFLSVMKYISFQNNKIGNLIYKELKENKSKSIKKKNHSFKFCDISFNNSLIQKSISQKSNSWMLKKK